MTPRWTPGRGYVDKATKLSRKISVALPNDVMAAVIAEAERRQVSTATIIREAVCAWVAAEFGE